jgi:hypothetical protein
VIGGQGLLLIRDETGPMLQYSIASKAVEDTKEMFRATQVEYSHLLGVMYDSVLPRCCPCVTPMEHQRTLYNRSHANLDTAHD